MANVTARQALMAALTMRSIREADALPLPDAVRGLALGLVRSVAVTRRVAVPPEFSVVDLGPVPADPPYYGPPARHAPVVTTFEVSRQADSISDGMGNTYRGLDDSEALMTLDWGDRDEEWHLGPRFLEIARDMHLHGRRAREMDLWELMPRLALTISAEARAQMHHALQGFADALRQAADAMARSVRQYGENRRLPRLDDLNLPPVTFDREPLVTAAQYATFVEWGRVEQARGEAVRRALLEMPRPRANDHMLDAARYAVGRLYGDNAFVDRVGGKRQSAITPEMDERAEALLLTLLSPEQRKTYQEAGYFILTAPSRNRYRLSKHARSYNVVRLTPDNRTIEALCALPPNAHAVPMADQLVSQMLMLKSDEREYLRIANRDPAPGYRGGPLARTWFDGDF